MSQMWMVKEVLYMNQRFKELFKNSIYENKINETIFGVSAYTNSFEEMYSQLRINGLMYIGQRLSGWMEEKYVFVPHMR